MGLLLAGTLLDKEDLQRWVEASIDEVSKVEGEIVKTTFMGPSIRIRFKSGSTYKLSFEKRDSLEVFLDNSANKISQEELVQNLQKVADDLVALRKSFKTDKKSMSIQTGRWNTK